MCGCTGVAYEHIRQYSDASRPTAYSNMCYYCNNNDSYYINSNNSSYIDNNNDNNNNTDSYSINSNNSRSSNIIYDMCVICVM